MPSSQVGGEGEPALSDPWKRVGCHTGSRSPDPGRPLRLASLLGAPTGRGGETPRGTQREDGAEDGAQAGTAALLLGLPPPSRLVTL